MSKKNNKKNVHKKVGEFMIHDRYRDFLECLIKQAVDILQV